MMIFLSVFEILYRTGKPKPAGNLGDGFPEKAGYMKKRPTGAEHPNEPFVSRKASRGMCPQAQADMCLCMKKAAENKKRPKAAGPWALCNSDDFEISDTLRLLP